MKTLTNYLAANPVLVRALLAATAAALQVLIGPKFDAAQLQHVAEGLLVGWAILPRPGDTGIVHDDDAPGAVR